MLVVVGDGRGKRGGRSADEGEMKGRRDEK